MKKPTTKMPDDLLQKCHIAIHTATIAAGTAGAAPIPMSDAIPIGAAQVTMIVALGNIFDITVTRSVAKSILSVGLAQSVGQSIVSNVLKAIPGIGTLAGSALGGVTAASITETLGWLVADDFYRISLGQEPENIIDAAQNLKDNFLK